MPVFSPALLRAARERSGMRREHLAVAVDRAVSTITKYEAGTLVPSATLLAAIAQALNADPGDFFTTRDTRRVAA